MSRGAGFVVEVEGQPVRIVPVDWMRGYSFLLADDVLFVPDMGERTHVFARLALGRIRDEKRRIQAAT